MNYYVFKIEFYGDKSTRVMCGKTLNEAIINLDIQIKCYAKDLLDNNTYTITDINYIHPNDVTHEMIESSFMKY